MTLLKRWRKRLRALVRKDEVEGELNEELAFHLEMETQKHIRAGVDPGEARRRARLAFGGVDSHKEQVRDARFFGWIDNLIADVRFTFRQYRRRPGTTLTIVLVLALGIGVNCVLFAASYSMLTQPATGIERDEALVRIRVEDRLEAVADYANRVDLFEQVAAYGSSGAVIETGESGSMPFSAVAMPVTPSYFPTLNVRPVLGATLPLQEDAAGTGAIGVVISHDLWIRHYDRSSSVLGRTLRINGHPATVVGVAPPGFMGVDQRASEPAVWFPLSAHGILGAQTSPPVPYSVFIIARLRKGIDRERVQAEIESINPLPHARIGASSQRWAIDVAPLLGHNRHPGGDRDTFLMVSLASTLGILILLVTVTNTSGLLLGIAINRGRELAIRLSVGAGRLRIIRQLLTESVILSLVSGLVGTLIAWRLVLAIGDSMLGLRVVADWNFVSFAVLLATGTGLLFGLSPALHATRKDLGQVLRSGSATTSGSRHRLQNGLIVSQIILTQPLLLFLVLMLHVAYVQYRDSAGREVHEEIAVISIGMGSSGSVEERISTAEAIRDHVKALPGVRAATFGTGGSRSAVVSLQQLSGTDAGVADSVEIWGTYVADDFFETMGIPLLAGRYFDETDPGGEGSPIILGDDLARKLWGHENPVGRTLEMNGEKRAVIGVVNESATRSSQTIFENLFFSPAPSGFWGRVLIRMDGPAEPRLGYLQQELGTEFRGTAISSASTLAIDERESLRAAVQLAASIGAAGLLALLLAAVGLSAAISFAVARRTKEIGIRSALGATSLRIMTVFIRSGLGLGLIGLAVGLPISLFFSRIFLSQGNLLTLPRSVAGAIVAGSVLAVTLIATWLPARRAARLDPLRALKVE